MRPLTIPLAAVLALSAGPVLAHHPFSAEFDRNAPIQLTGKVTRVDWTAPHVMIHLKAKDGAGPMRDWKLEGGSPEQLRRLGWTKTATLKKGDRVTVKGYRAKSAPYVMAAREIEVHGKTIAARDPNDGGPKA